MKILLIYPETPTTTFWSFSNAIKFISKKASDIPLGLLTIASMLPKDWEKKLIDMNVSVLKDKHLLWADYVFISGMSAQIISFKKVINRCNQLGVKVVAGGPMVTLDPQDFLGIDHMVLDEAEHTLPQFLSDLEQGIAKPVYRSNEFPDISQTPAPMYSLLKKKRYAGMNIQYSRGCPFDCDFCTITKLNGRNPRTKSTQQFLAELDALYNIGWRGMVFIVDDNFIGHKSKLKKDFLPALVEWSENKKYPFAFTTEVSINLADDEELVKLMVKAGFQHTFVGIETPNDDSLAECGKKQNLKRDLVSSVKTLQRHGLIVSGGFIVGFDNDPINIFENQIKFIQKSGIVTAMVGLLNAPSGTKLFERLKQEGRLLQLMSGDNMDGSINFIPKMSYQKLIQGYKEILDTIYSQKHYYERVKTFLQEYTLPAGRKPQITFTDLRAFFRSMWRLGVIEKGRLYYWRLLFFSIRKCPQKFAVAVTMAIYGFHFRRVVEGV